MTGGTVAGDAYLTHDELCSLSFDHKYKSNGCSFLDTLCMRDFWTWLVVPIPCPASSSPTSCLAGAQRTFSACELPWSRPPLRERVSSPLGGWEQVAGQGRACYCSRGVEHNTPENGWPRLWTSLFAQQQEVAASRQEHGPSRQPP